MTNYSYRKLNVGIIGLGVGESHINGYLSHSKCEVVALCDFNDEVYKKAKIKYPKYYITKNAKEILDNPDIDVISIASWDNYHYEQIINGIKNNKHLFIEKPIVLYEKEAKNVRNLLSKKPELKISSNLILRKSPRFSELKEMIETGILGNLSYIHGGYNYGRIKKLTQGWRGNIEFYSVVYGGGIHLIDLMMWMTGKKIVEVASFGNNIQTKQSNFKYNDMVVTILRFEDDVVGHLSCNFGCVSPHFHQFEVYGTKGTFVNDRKYALLYKNRDIKDGNYNKLLVPKTEYKDSSPQKIFSKYRGIQKGAHIRNFIDSIVYNTEPEIKLDEIFNTMSVCFAIEKSVKLSKSVIVNYI